MLLRACPTSPLDMGPHFHYRSSRALMARRELDQRCSGSGQGVLQTLLALRVDSSSHCLQATSVGDRALAAVSAESAAASAAASAALSSSASSAAAEEAAPAWWRLASLELEQACGAVRGRCGAGPSEAAGYHTSVVTQLSQRGFWPIKVEVDRVVMYEAMRPGDIVRAMVASLGDSRSYHLSTARADLGVIVARSEARGIMVPLSWKEMQCPLTGAKELRKVSDVRQLFKVGTASAATTSAAAVE